MSMLGKGGKGLKDRLRRQYSLINSDAGTQLEDVVVPIVLVDDLTRGLTVDDLYRRPAIAYSSQAGVVGEQSYSYIRAPSAQGAAIFVDYCVVSRTAAGKFYLAGGYSGFFAGSTKDTTTKFWKDRRLPGIPSAEIAHGSNVGVLTGGIWGRFGNANSHTHILVPIGATIMPPQPGQGSELSSVLIFNVDANQALQVSWVWEEINLPEQG